MIIVLGKVGNDALKIAASYEPSLPFIVAHAYDEALGIDTPHIWTAEHNRLIWDAQQGNG